MEIKFLAAHLSRNGERCIPDQWIINDPLFPGGLSFHSKDEAVAYVATAVDGGK